MERQLWPSVYHYTSREGAQSIRASGSIFPGARGKVFLSPDLYAAGVEAAMKLAITGKPVEMVVVLPAPDIVVTVEKVDGINLADRWLRPGGGSQIVFDSQVFSEGFPMLTLAQP